MDKITLKNPIKINGETVNELHFDIDAVTNKEYMDALASRENGKAGQIIMPLNDYQLHFSLGLASIVAANREKNWTRGDFSGLRGGDNQSIMMIGFSFFTGSGGDQPDDSSDEQSGAIPSDSTHPGTN